jgi:hypothetical protein
MDMVENVFKAVLVESFRERVFLGRDSIFMTLFYLLVQGDVLEYYYGTIFRYAFAFSLHS